MSPEIQVSAQPNTQRIQVSLSPGGAEGKRVQILVENHDERLGWYTSGSLVLPLHQLPLLEQAIDEMRRAPAEPEYAEIIPFPGPNLELSA
jgi:hypothetical protein